MKESLTGSDKSTKDNVLESEWKETEQLGDNQKSNRRTETNEQVAQASVREDNRERNIEKEEKAGEEKQK